MLVQQLERQRALGFTCYRDARPQTVGVLYAVPEALDVLCLGKSEARQVYQRFDTVSPTRPDLARGLVVFWHLEGLAACYQVDNKTGEVVRTGCGDATAALIKAAALRTGRPAHVCFLMWVPTQAVRLVGSVDYRQRVRQCVEPMATATKEPNALLPWLKVSLRSIG